MKRAIIIVIDSLGIGAAEDCAEFNDVKTCNTICNVANFVDGLNMPNFERFGLGNLAAIEGIIKADCKCWNYERNIKRQMHDNRTLGNGRARFGKAFQNLPKRF